MDLSMGVSSQGTPQAPKDSSSGIDVAGNTSVKSDLPLVDQPIKDYISQSTALPNTAQSNYTASAQVPVLPKPQEEEIAKKTSAEENAATNIPPTKTGENSKTENSKTEKKETKAEHSEAQGPDGSTDTPVLADPDEKSHKGQDQEEGQQSNSGGGNSGGQDSSGSNTGGGFSGDGQNKGGSKEFNVAASISAKTDNYEDAEVNTTVAAKTSSTDSVSQTNTSQNANATTAPIDPLKAATTISASGLFSPPINPAQFFDNGGKLMQELYDVQSKFVSSLPDGPDKMRYTDFLKLVQSAISDFQKLLHELQSSDQTGAADRTKARLETTLAKIESHREQQAEVNQKRQDAAQKMKIMGPLMAVFAFLMVILLAALLVLFATTLLLAGPAGWMVMAMMVCELVDQFATMIGQKPFLMAKFAEAVGTVFDAIVESAHKSDNLTAQEMKEAKTVGRTIMTAVTLALGAMVAAPAVLLGGVMALISYLKASNIIKDMSIQNGATEQEAQQAEMITNIVIMATVAIILVVISIICPPASFGTAFASISQAITNATSTAARMATFALTAGAQLSAKTKDFITAVFRNIFELILDPEMWVSVSMLGLTTTEAVTSFRYHKTMAEIAILQGELDSEMTLKEAIIDILKKMIKQLIESLSQTGEDIKQLGELFRKTLTDSSQASTALFG